MAKPPWKPWHEVVELRDELKSGDLSLQMFAADLREAHAAQQAAPRMQKAGIAIRRSPQPTSSASLTHWSVVSS
jgi:hypothetical protein